MKLIVSDVDGTLLRRTEKTLNKNIIQAIEKILCTDCIFCAASGRTYVELLEIFKGFEDRIYFIASDGAIIVYKGETLCNRPIDKAKLDGVSEYTAHGKYIIYVQSKKQMTVRNAMKQYRNHVIKVDSSDEIDREIYKITDFSKSEKALPIIYEDFSMREYVSENTNKGEAVKALMQLLSVSADDCYVFGDGANDIEMFEAVKNSFAVMSAPPAVKKHANKIVENFETEIDKLI